MTNVPPQSFVKKSTAEELLPRSGRQLTRDISKAVARREVDSLRCFQLRLLDETLIEGVDIEDIGIVKQLGLDGRGPEWYVDVDSWRIILDNRARSRTRPSNSRPSVENVDQEPQTIEVETAGSVPQKEEENNQHGNYLAELLKEKDFRTKELKDSKDYLEQLLEKLIGKDTLKALAEIVGNEGVNSNQLVSLVKTTTTKSKNSVSNSAAPENEVSKEIEEETQSTKRQPKTEPVVISVDSNEADATKSEKAKLANQTKKKTAKKIRQPASRKSVTRSKKSKQSNSNKKQLPKWYDMPTINRILSRNK